MEIFVQILIGCALVITVSSASSAVTADKNSAEDQGTETSKKVDRRHPNYVRCRTEPIIGSLARKRRICMTNAEWTEYIRTGSRNAKEFVDDSQPGFMMTPN